MFKPQLQGGEPGLAADGLSRDLVHRDAVPDIRPLGLLGMDSGEIGSRGPGVVAGTVAESTAVVVGQSAEPQAVVPVVLQWLEDGRHFEVGALAGRSPVGHDDPVGNVDKGQAGRCIGRGRRLGRKGGNHGIQPGKADGYSHPTQKGSPWKVSWRHDPPPLVVLIWNGRLSTMDWTSWPNLKPLFSSSRQIRSTAALS